MKGIIFREFLNMVEQEFGDEMADTMIIESKIPNKGAYTSVGTYDHTELIKLVSVLSDHTNIETRDLIKSFGKKVFSVFSVNYSSMFNNIHDGFAFLETIEDTIHKEVLKLYPEAELPSINTKRKNENALNLTYKSSRKMSDFAEGLIHGCMQHFKENYLVIKKLITEDGTIVEFTISRK
jgi:hypothetical protein